MAKCTLDWNVPGLDAIINYDAESVHGGHAKIKTLLYVNDEKDVLTIISQGEEVELLKEEAEKLLSWLQVTIPHMTTSKNFK
ncbi:hypothetical protein vBEclMUFV01_208 [Enterobacter phage vB_EclM-UFV01]|nr:hypothetical protein vBEclMUFV01_208 [Enterobacter phage vB_EclM-UFV01]